MQRIELNEVGKFPDAKKFIHFQAKKLSIYLWHDPSTPNYQAMCFIRDEETFSDTPLDKYLDQADSTQLGLVLNSLRQSQVGKTLFDLPDEYLKAIFGSNSQVYQHLLIESPIWQLKRAMTVMPRELQVRLIEYRLRKISLMPSPLHCLRDISDPDRMLAILLGIQPDVLRETIKTSAHKDVFLYLLKPTNPFDSHRNFYKHYQYNDKGNQRQSAFLCHFNQTIKKQIAVNHRSTTALSMHSAFHTLHHLVSDEPVQQVRSRVQEIEEQIKVNAAVPSPSR